MPERKFTADQARVALIEAANKILDDTRNPMMLTLASAIEESGVPRPSSYRVFADDEVGPRFRFLCEVAKAIADDMTSTGSVSSIGELLSVEDSAKLAGGKASPEEQAKFLRRALDGYVDQQVDIFTGNPRWHFVQMMNRALRVNSVDESTSGYLMESVGEVLVKIVSTCKVIARGVGLAPKSKDPWEDFYFVAEPVVEGVLLEASAPKLDDGLRHPAAIMLEVLIGTHTVADPRFVASADLSLLD